MRVYGSAGTINLDIYIAVLVTLSKMGLSSPSFPALAFLFRLLIL